MKRVICNLISTILFMEALDATMLYVALPKITLGYGGLLLQGDWVIIGFLLAVALSMYVSSWLVYFIGMKKTFLYAQAGYIFASFACGFSNNLNQLIVFRVLQGIFAGIIIPIAINYWIRTRNENQHRFTGSRLYLYEMILALTLGPIYAGYVANFIGWRALFFIKVPISIICFFFSWFLLKTYKVEEKKIFHWKGYLLFSLALYFLIFSITEIFDSLFKHYFYLSIIAFLFAITLIICFVRYELTSKNPIMNFHLFKNPNFSLGIFLQSIVMLIFMGTIFILSIFLIGVQKFDVVDTGWIVAGLGVGLFGALLLMRIIKNLIPDVVLIVVSLTILSISMFLITQFTRDTPKIWIAFIIFLEGLAAGSFRIVNANLLFHQNIAKDNLEDMSKIFTFTNQLMITIGVAVTVMIVKLNLRLHNIPNLSWATPEAAFRAFKIVFYILASLPIAGIFVAIITKMKLNFNRLK